MFGDAQVEERLSRALMLKASASDKPASTSIERAAQLAHRVSQKDNTKEVFRADRFEEVSLSDWLAHSPIDMVAETLNLDPSVIAQFPKNRPDIVPA